MSYPIEKPGREHIEALRTRNREELEGMLGYIRAHPHLHPKERIRTWQCISALVDEMVQLEKRYELCVYGEYGGIYPDTQDLVELARAGLLAAEKDADA